MDDIIKTRGLTKEYKDDRGGAGTVPSAVLGIVKNNVDPTRSGRIEVYLNRLNGPDQDNPAYWTTVRYLSPFFGYTPNTGGSSGYGDYVSNPNSYGFWATPPDIGTEVVCVFLNGDPNEGFYIGSVPPIGLTHMTPAIGASASVIPNEGEAKSYGGALRLPVTEINNANSKQDNNLKLAYQPRPVHSYQAAIYNKQGLIRDPERGPIGSSSVRETPSRVFGMSTPGRPIYQGGYTDETIKSAISGNESSDKFKVIGRTGGHTFVMDDGDVAGKDQLVRLRTSNGHQILMSDSGQTLFIIHANGQSYIELGKEGTIDMYSTNSVNIRTQGDLNLHADRNININAAKDLVINAENIRLESEKDTSQFAGGNTTTFSKGNHTTKAASAVSLEAGGQASLAAGAEAFVNGSKVNLNTGSTGTKPQEVKQVAKIQHTDTLYDSSKGYAAAPGALSSIVSRAPAHAPWADANKGVDAKVNLSSSSKFPSPPSPAISTVNAVASNVVKNPTTNVLASTVPNVANASSTLDAATTGSIVSQMAVNAANGTTADAVKKSLDVVEKDGTKTAVIGQLGMTPSQLSAAGIIKPGAEAIINKNIQNGMSIEQAIPTNLLTGKNGINSVADLAKNIPAQVSVATDLISKGEKALVQTGIITGKESPTQTAGLILSTVTSGLGATVDFVKKAAGNVTSAVSTLLPSGSLNPLAGPASALVSAGNFAANLADKAKGFAGIADSIKGVASGMFSKVTSLFKPMQAKVPQDLEAIAVSNVQENEATNTTTSAVSPAEASQASALSKVGNYLGKALTNAGGQIATAAVSKALGTNAQTSAKIVDKAFSSASSWASGLSNLPGGADSVANNVTADLKSSLPGAGAVESTLKSISNSVSGTMDSVSAAVSGLKSKLLSGASLTSLASGALNPNDQAKLNSALSSLSIPGSVEVKLPTVATDTVDKSELVAQSKELLGDPKVPPIKV